MLLLTLGYLLRSAPTAGTGAEEDRLVGVALVREDGEETQYEDAAANSNAVNESMTANGSSLAAALPTQAAQQIDLSSVLPTAGDDLGLSGSLDMPSAAGQATGQSQLGAMTARVRTSVFGTSGTGSNFIYVFDRSGSMAGFGGRPLAAAKAELIASLQDLHDTNQFQIIFYNEEPHVFRVRSGSPSLVWGTEASKAAAARFIQGISASGSTRHLEPLRMALGLHPDVVFFLTDADEPELTPAELQQVRRWNNGSAVNAIEFGFGPQTRHDNFLVRLARQNGGQHVYIDVSTLGERR
ncbi:MAG: hypothetical protein KDA92_09690 [Planctomycetales bacterium]|nr:hypothetical protein [Planctomycetales bacterium]